MLRLTIYLAYVTLSLNTDGHTLSFGIWSVDCCYCCLLLFLLFSWYQQISPWTKMETILADEYFKCIFLNGNDRFPIWISLKFVPMSPYGNTPALVQVMAWYRPGDRPLPEPMYVQWNISYLIRENTLKMLTGDATKSTDKKQLAGWRGLLKIVWFMTWL